MTQEYKSEGRIQISVSITGKYEVKILGSTLSEDDLLYKNIVSLEEKLAEEYSKDSYLETTR